MKKSTYLREISYDSKTRNMDVVFRDGAEVRYYDVHPRTYAAIDGADSAGEKFSRLVHDHKFKVMKTAA